MLDMKFIREHPEIIRKDLEKRGDNEKLSWVDEIITKDASYRELLQESQKLRHTRNKLTADINELKKAGKDISEKLAEAKSIPEKIKSLEEKSGKLAQEIKGKRMRLPNILHESVPIGKDDTENEVIREVGKKKEHDFELISHGEWLEKNDQADFKKAAMVSGAGFYYLKDKIKLLELALQKFAIDSLVEKGYTLVEPPFMLRRKPYEGVTDLEDFEKVMYKIDNDDLYLIATSEHAIGALFMDETIEKLPVKYAGVSACFRREIGSHGLDTKGLFRVHQFNKVEQFIFCKPEDSWEHFEELIGNAEELFKALELPYRIVNICTGDIGIVAAKKYDLEVWMPREKRYREAVSCSNCTSYQAVRLNVKYKKGAEKEYVYTLNSTAIATSRALRAIIENFQQKDGSVVIPKVLRPYMNGIKKV
ncbi:serine--tRNA ligase [Candidatus Woesearchaeota archaeon]|nr:serine--tRNA ligase [Candidatus Woesearchaeota archaeon]